MLSVAEQKKQFRQQIRKKLIQYRSHHNWKSWNQQLIENLVKWLNSQPQFSTIATFSSNYLEIDLSPLVSRLSEISWVYPKVIDAKQLSFHQVDDYSNLNPGYKNILEPITSPLTQVSLEKIDLVLLPGLGFDCKGRRLGQGGGFYDRFLSQDLQIMRLGIAFDLQVVDSLPYESHDVDCQAILTEKGLITCYNDK